MQGYNRGWWLVARGTFCSNLWIPLWERYGCHWWILGTIVFTFFIHWPFTFLQVGRSLLVCLGSSFEVSGSSLHSSAILRSVGTTSDCLACKIAAALPGHEADSNTKGWKQTVCWKSFKVVTKWGESEWIWPNCVFWQMGCATTPKLFGQKRTRNLWKILAHSYTWHKHQPKSFNLLPSTFEIST